MKNFLIGFVVMLASAIAFIAVSDEAKQKVLDAAMWSEAKLSSMSKERVTIDGHEIVYLERTSENPDVEVIFLLHGFTADKSNWLRFVRHIPNKYRIIAPDWPAHGESTYLVGADYSLQTQANRLRLMMEKLGIDKAHLVGNSMGGAIAANFASRFQGKVLTLTLIDSGGADNPKTESEVEIAMRSGRNPLLVNTPQDFPITVGLAMEQPPLIPWPVNKALANIAAERQPRFTSVFGQIHGGVTNTQVDYLRDIQAPTLIMWGDHDRILDVGNAEIFQSAIPCNETVIYKGIGHMPMLEVPEQSAKDVVQFIESH